MGIQCNNCGHTIPENKDHCEMCNKHKDDKGYKPPVRYKLVGILMLCLVVFTVFFIINKTLMPNEIKTENNMSNKDVRQIVEWEIQQAKQRNDNDKFNK